MILHHINPRLTLTFRTDIGSVVDNWTTGYGVHKIQYCTVKVGKDYLFTIVSSIRLLFVNFV